MLCPLVKAPESFGVEKSVYREEDLVLFKLLTWRNQRIACVMGWGNPYVGNVDLSSCSSKSSRPYANRSPFSSQNEFHGATGLR
jgi:hypothetical protein